MASKFKPFGLALLTAAALRSYPQLANAAAPMPIRTEVDVAKPEDVAIQKFEAQLRVEKVKKYEAFKRKAAKIEAEHGADAKKQFEKDYTAQQDRLEQQKVENLENLKHQLLEKGVAPVVDPEWQRQLVLLKTGRDLADVPGTKQYVQQMMSKRKGSAAASRDKTLNREVLKLVVQDLKNRDIDVMEYFNVNRFETEKIYQMTPSSAKNLLEEYHANMVKYGQIAPPEPGTLSVLEKRNQDPDWQKKQEENKKKQLAAQAAEAKAVASAEKAKAKAEAKKQKEAAKEEAKKQKAAAKLAAQEAKEAKKKESQAKKAAAAAASAAASTMSSGPELTEIAPSAESDEVTEETVAVEQPAVVEAKSTATADEGLKILPVAAVVAAVGGGGYAFKTMRANAAVAEEERQRQFKLIMGEGAGSKPTTPKPTAPALELDSFVDEIIDEPPKAVESEPPKEEDVPTASEPESTPTPAADEPAPKKRGLGIKSMFSRRNTNSRETDLNVLVGADAKAPGLATLIAKIFTYGAPGRFPSVQALPGAMPMEVYDLERAKELLGAAKETVSFTSEEYAELFADVMNCMLVDIVDLASSSLKEDDKVTFEAINVVVDFMNHASVLFDETAEVSFVLGPNL